MSEIVKKVDKGFDMLEGFLGNVEQGLKKRRGRQWLAMKERIGFVLHSFEVEEVAECGKEFPEGTESVVPTGNKTSLCCERCLLIRSGE